MNNEPVRGRQFPRRKAVKIMILNACVRQKTMIDEKVCKNCKDKNCRHAGEPTTKERLDMYSNGTNDYRNGEKDEAI